ncbi:M23 family metallopeptidase [Sphingobacterium sp. FBM7-1]|uniref:M23 family metallopeptidase n=1 Tax=Sphingobacterium sp. FBM7-1 TaxID=2886688 RepID=UPI001D125760|nr:M23 family metallopeptidase [Sphingobacterium sp. FBM7-1]MCC2598270.1 M23 family metallopeptidase [Sphingobacterium sp. FBM7-1]
MNNTRRSAYLRIRFFFGWLVLVPFMLCGQDIDYSPPLDKLKVTSPFGYRIHPISGKASHHSGVDFAARSDPVFNVLNGYVKATGRHKALGKYIRIVHGEVETIYGHLSHILVSSGDTVIAGQPIAITGSTGRVTGEHLHFSVKFNGKFLDPLKFLRRLREQLDQSLNME